MGIIKFILFWPFFSTIFKSKRSKRFKFAFGGLRILAIFPMLFLVTECNYYYKVITTDYPQSEVIASLAGMNKSFVIHSGSEVFIIDSLLIENDSIKGNYVAEYTLPFERDSFPKANSSNRYRMNKGDSRILNEVHIYLQTSYPPTNHNISFALSDISRLDIYDPDKDKTILSWFAGCVIGVLAVPVLIFIIILVLVATGSSCPFIYVYNGDSFEFAGEIYSGAVYVPLERDDYLVLPQLVAVNGAYKLKISNELPEVQHTNLTELLVIDHPEGTEVLVDKFGHYQTAVDIISPTLATNSEGTDILPIIKDKDSLIYYGTDPRNEIPLTEEIILTFDHPKNASSGKLFIRARNSLWLDNVYKNFHGMLGNYHDKWVEKQNNSDGTKMVEWSLSQKIPLLIYVGKKRGMGIF